MTRWWIAEGKELYSETSGGLRMLDMAAGRYAALPTSSSRFD
jgi:hypothetical protein